MEYKLGSIVIMKKQHPCKTNRFAIVRVGYGTKGTLDNRFKRNADLCKSLGIPFGFYWYSYALNAAGASQEAQACIRAIEPYKNDYSMGV